MLKLAKAVLALGLSSTVVLGADSEEPRNFAAMIDLFALAGEDTAYESNHRSESRYRGVGGAMRAGYFASPLSLQANVQGSILNAARDSNQFSDESLTMSIHAGARDSELGYIGAWGALSFHQVDYDAPVEWSQSLWGLEAQAYFDRVTFWAQAGVFEPYHDPNDEGWNNGSFVRGGVRIFPAQDVKFEASAGMLAGDEYARSSKYQHLSFWKLGAEYHPEGEPISIYVEYAGHHADEKNWAYMQMAGLVGVRFLIGRETLLSLDRAGPSLDMLDPSLITIAYDH